MLFAALRNELMSKVERLKRKQRRMKMMGIATLKTH